MDVPIAYCQAPQDSRKWTGITPLSQGLCRANLMPVRNLHIEGFRGFDRFDMHGLGRVNLIVGTNNSGKTTVLEALAMLMATGSVRPLWDSQTIRGEDFWAEHESERPLIRHVDV